MKTKLLYFVSHPIQYQAPLLRRISSDPMIDLTVIFESDFSQSEYFDKGFGINLEWDIPLRQGYASKVLHEVDVLQQIKAVDVVWFHGWQSKAFKKLMRLSTKLNTPVLVRGENWQGAMPDGRGLKGWLKRLYLKQIFSYCDGFLAIGSANRQYYVEHGVSSKKIFDMPYAVDNAFFQVSGSNGGHVDFRQEFGIQDGQKIVLFAGKLSHRKKPDLLLKAWEKANWQEDQRPALVFVGDGDLFQSLKSAAKSSEYSNHIYFAGFRNQSKLPKIYQAADVFVLPSEKEPWGLAINEAMAAGTAIIASDQCGAAFDLVSENTGALVRTGNLEDLIDALTSSVANSEKLGKGAKDKIKHWDFDADLAGLKSALLALGVGG